MNSKFIGCLVGLACGDALGAAVEFMPRGTFPPVTGMMGGGKFKPNPGEWTDDTSMAICLAESLIACRGFGARDQMSRYLAWANSGQPGPKNFAIGIGKTVFKSLMRFASTGEEFAQETSNSNSSAGNGALMRLCPIVLAFHPSHANTMYFTRQMALTTHSAPECIETSLMLAELLMSILGGASKADMISERPELELIQRKPPQEIHGTGYAPESLEAAIWSFLTTDNFRDAILAATNLGDDADTTAAICGQLAGAYYGVEGIPEEWRERLSMGERIEGLGKGLYELSRELNAASFNRDCKNSVPPSHQI